MPDDARWTQLAAQLAHGTGVRCGSKVAVFMSDPFAMPAVEAFVGQCYRLGAYPQVLATDERFDRLAVEFASLDLLAQPAPLEVESMRWADVHVSFRAMVTPGTRPAEDARLAAQRRGKGVVSALRWEETSWSLVRIPTPAWARMIGVPFDTLLTEFFAGCLAPWDALRPRWDSLCRTLEAEDHLRILSDDSDLLLGTAGRRWVSFAGEANLPDGEIATAPLNDCVNGHIRFPGTFWFAGAAISDLELGFADGSVASVAARKGQGLVEALLDTDTGSRRVGELGIGTNAGVKVPTGDLLIDEKILGTVHIALGRAYPSCGGTNQSSLHWDIVKDLRTPGSFLFAGDRELISNGRITGLLSEASGEMP